VVPAKGFSESGEATGSGALAATMRAERVPLRGIYEGKTGGAFEDKDGAMKDFEEQRKSQKQ
jgi:hypothetical protein